MIQSRIMVAGVVARYTRIPRSVLTWRPPAAIDAQRYPLFQ